MCRFDEETIYVKRSRYARIKRDQNLFHRLVSWRWVAAAAAAVAFEMPIPNFCQNLIAGCQTMTTTIVQPVSQYDHRFGAKTKDVATFLSRCFIACLLSYFSFKGSSWATSPAANTLSIDKYLMPPLFRNTELLLFFRNALHPDVSLLLVGMSYRASARL